MNVGYQKRLAHIQGLLADAANLDNGTLVQAEASLKRMRLVSNGYATEDLAFALHQAAELIHNTFTSIERMLP